MNHTNRVLFLNVALIYILLAPIAFAENVRNPLHNLDFDEVCKPTEPGKKPLTKLVMIQKNDGSKIGIRFVKNEYIIDKLQDHYNLSIPFSALKDSTPQAELKKLVAPCSQGVRMKKAVEDELIKAAMALGMSKTEAQADAEEKLKSKTVCDEAELFKADTKRFKNKPLKFRRALLSLFKSAEIGSPTNFVTITDPWRISGAAKIDGSLYAVEYKPFLNPHIDDILIGRFIDYEYDGKGESSSFRVACKTGVKENFPTVQQTIPDNSNDENVILIENVIKRPSTFDTLENGLMNIGKEKDQEWLSNKSFTAQRKLLLVKSPGEFAKPKGDSAEIGISAEAGNETTLNANAAIGFRYKWKSQKSWVEEKNRELSFSISPFVAIDQNAIETKRLDPTSADPLNISETTVAFAELSAGVRFDIEQQGKINTWDDYKDNLSRRISYAGTRQPGWRAGGVWERFTDNNNNQHGERWGFEVSPPAKYVFLPGYRRPIQLLQANLDWGDKHSDREGKPLEGFDHWYRGWVFEWDAELALDRIDYLEAPLNFDTVFENDRRDVDEFSVVGTNIGFDLSRLTPFGHPDDSGWLSLSVDYSFRDGYENQDFNSAEKWEVDVTLAHIDNTNLSVGATYEVGRDFKSLTESDVLSLKLKANY